MDSAPIIDDTPNSRFILEMDGEISELVYRRSGRRLILIHTEVPESLGGHGLGGQLVRAALHNAVSEELTVVPVCPYVRTWLTEHPDEAATVQVDWEPPS
jgi:predicted GNAT family acetyltransferase